MLRESHHKLLIKLLALAVVFAPVQSAVSAIEMLDHNTGSSQHCQLDMAGHTDMDSMSSMDSMDSMDHAGCCQHDGTCQDSCSTCAQGIAVQAMFSSLVIQTERPSLIFTPLHTGLPNGIPPGSEFRPPRIIS